jgi:hypothetical protein
MVPTCGNIGVLRVAVLAKLNRPPALSREFKTKTKKKWLIYFFRKSASPCVFLHG